MLEVDDLSVDDKVLDDVPFSYSFVVEREYLLLEPVGGDWFVLGNLKLSKEQLCVMIELLLKLTPFDHVAVFIVLYLAKTSWLDLVVAAQMSLPSAVPSSLDQSFRDPGRLFFHFAEDGLLVVV